MYIADTGNDRVAKLSPLGQAVALWGQTGQGPGEFSQPYGVSVDGDGAVYVADHSNNRIQKLSASGTPVAQWGAYGLAPGQFNNPRSVVVDAHGDVYVADSFNNRIQKLSAAGAPLAEWLVVNDAGDIVDVDADNDRLQRYVPTIGQ